VGRSPFVFAHGGGRFFLNVIPPPGYLTDSILGIGSHRIRERSGGGFFEIGSARQGKARHGGARYGAARSGAAGQGKVPFFER
jgi:hypothetical protein